MTTLHDLEAQTIDSKEKKLSDYAGQVLLVVNVASRCGLTPQYEGLEALYRRYRDKGFQVLGFPCNDFAGQEPGTEEEIQSFCTTRYDVTFPLFSKIRVLGGERHPVYAYLTTQNAPPKGPGDVDWNFEKFLVDPSGNVVGRFSPTTPPLDADITGAIERLLEAART